MKIESVKVITVSELLPVFNNNTMETVKAIMKLNRQMKMNNLMDLALWISLLGTVSVVGSMLKQIDIQKQQIEVLTADVRDLHTVINTKDKDEEM